MALLTLNITLDANDAKVSYVYHKDFYRGFYIACVVKIFQVIKENFLEYFSFEDKCILDFVAFFFYDFSVSCYLLKDPPFSINVLSYMVSYK